MFLPMLIRTPFGWVILLGLAIWWGYRNFFGGAAEAPPTKDVPGQTATATGKDAELVHFVSFVLDDTQSTWDKMFSANGKQYRHAKLVLFTDATQTACGYGESATGPFYCPSDERVYIDVGFYKELSTKFGAKGQFAEAYVVAHEIGHHVQKILGISEKATGLRGPSKGATGSSVRLELQADCFAGIWARSTDQRKLLEAGDIESALGAATAIGDDRLQRQSTGTVSPEKWTHGSSEERVRWFKVGFEKGSIDACDTFSAPSL